MEAKVKGMFYPHQNIQKFNEVKSKLESGQRNKAVMDAEKQIYNREWNFPVAEWKDILTYTYLLK